MKEFSDEKCLRVTSEILQLLKTSNQHEEVFDLIIDRVVRIFRCQTCAIVIIDPKSEYLRIENGHGVSLTYSKSFKRHFSTGVIGQLLWTGRPLLIPDSSLQPGVAEEMKLENSFASAACVQIAMNHRALGYLHVDSAVVHAFDERDIVVLQAFADFAGVACYKDRLVEENMRLDSIDHETGVLKYPNFLEKLNVASDRAINFGEDFAVIMCDIDNFKMISQTYGYECSRDLLRELGEHLKARLRSMDAVGRYGFDEFIVLRSRCDTGSIVAYAEDLRQSIEGRDFTKQCLKTTVSVGLAIYPQNGRNLDDLLLTARKTLFESQRTGRNKVFHFPAVWYNHKVHTHKEEIQE